MPDPQKFFIGLMDFFSILLPGAVLAYVFSDVAGAPLFKADPIPGGAEGWVVFLFISYLLGHLIFLLGSMLDDPIYDSVRNATYEGQIRRLAGKKPRPAPWQRAIAKRIMKDRYDATLRHVLAIKKQTVPDVDGVVSINAFQWCKAHLTLQHKESVAIIERFEADSKFFRSFIVVLLLMLPWMLIEAQWTAALAVLLLLPLATWRYIDQRTKAVNQAYYLIIAEHAARPAGLMLDEPMRAGGVVYRKTLRGFEYALVESSTRPGDWVLPKGHVRLGEQLAEAAVREVHEETGIWAMIEQSLGEVSYDFNGETMQVQFFLMAAVEVEASPEGRGCQWLSNERALQLIAYEETQLMLARAHRMLSHGASAPDALRLARQHA